MTVKNEATAPIIEIGLYGPFFPPNSWYKIPTDAKVYFNVTQTDPVSKKKYQCSKLEKKIIEATDVVWQKPLVATNWQVSAGDFKKMLDGIYKVLKEDALTIDEKSFKETINTLAGEGFLKPDESEKYLNSFDIKV